MESACRSPFNYTWINYSGDVVCQRFTVGNTHDATFKDNWLGAQAQQVRARVMQDDRRYLSCSHYRFCIKAGALDASAEANFTVLTGQQGS